MEFLAILQQVTRPYWSPVHPRRYIKSTPVPGALRLSGWGLIYPDDIGAFNLLWLMSGVGGPPDDYKRYGYAATWVMAYGHTQARRWTLVETAARMPLREFSEHVDKVFGKNQNYGNLKTLGDALRLKV